MESTKTGYCRLCAELKPTKKLMHLEESEEQKIIEKLIRVNGGTAVIFEGDILAKTVCFVCITSLDNAFDFVCGIEQAQTILTALVVEKQIKKESALIEDENIDFNIETYDPDDDIKYEDYTDVKPEGSYALNVPNTRKYHPVKRKKVKQQPSLDTLPLSQLKLTWKDYKWICSYCGTQFASAEEIKLHAMQYHSCCNAYRCEDCNIRKLKLDSFLTHVKRHRKYLKISCYKCYTSFSRSSETNRHKSEHDDAEFICPGCNTIFANSIELDQHKQAFFKIDKKTRDIPDLDMPKDSLTCILCHKNFKHKASLNTHLLIHTDRKRNHTCEKCGKCFLSKQTLAGHMMMHEDTRPFQCEICKFRFRTSGQLRAHVGVHDGHKPYECDQCGRCFRLPKQLKSHSIIHTDSLPHICSYCNKSFRFKSILNQHIRQHTGVKPYSCELCQRDFTNWPNYNKHMKRRHGMDMAKKKHTPEGLYPINPVTGEIINYAKSDKTMEWKKNMMKHKKPGRPKLEDKDLNDKNEQTK